MVQVASDRLSSETGNQLQSSRCEIDMRFALKHATTHDMNTFLPLLSSLLQRGVNRGSRLLSCSHTPKTMVRCVPLSQLSPSHPLWHKSVSQKSVPQSPGLMAPSDSINRSGRLRTAWHQPLQVGGRMSPPGSINRSGRLLDWGHFISQLSCIRVRTTCLMFVLIH